MLRGENPYDLIGPGNTFHSRLPVIYPATAFIAVTPLALLSEPWASLVFVAASSFLLAFVITRGTWHQVPVFASVAFVTNAQLAQWSAVAAALLYVPGLAWLTAVKPQAMLPAVIALRTRNAIIAFFVGAVILGAASLLLVPEWPRSWLHNIQATTVVTAPITRLGGFAILLVLLRWRRAESWLVLTMALLPQTWYSYNVLPLLLLGRTFVEAGTLSVLSSAGAFATAFLIDDLYSSSSARTGGAIQLLSVYLPAVVFILLRPNRTDPPPWQSFDASATNNMFRSRPQRAETGGTHDVAK